MVNTGVKNICLVAITRLGDMLQASPTITALKEEYPDCRITVVIEKQFSSICDGIPGIDEIYIIDLGMLYRCLMRDYHNIVDAYSYLDQIVKELRSRNFDFCINMSSSGYTALLLKMLDIKDSRGWISDEEGNRIISNPWAMLFAAYVFHANREYNSFNIVDNFRSSAGVSNFPKKLMYNTKTADHQYIKTFLEENKIEEGGPLICVQVGASQVKRQWSPVYFAKLSQYLVEEIGARVVYTGSKSEQTIINMVLANYNNPKTVSAAGVTNLGQLGALLEQSQLLITGDTGTMHMAVAVGTPVIALFLASAYCYETGPYSEGNIVLEPRVTCYPCNPNFACARPDCHAQILAESVKDVVKLRLEHSAAELQKIKLPPILANSKALAVKMSFFDQDGYLDFKLLNNKTIKDGVTEDFYQAARDAYRALWKEEFRAVSAQKIWSRVQDSGNGFDLIPALLETIRLAEKGIELIDKLINLIKDPLGLPILLTKTNALIQQNDKDLEGVGLANSVLGALTRMYVMEKQNLRGGDPLILAGETREMYVRLKTRTEKFGKLFAYYFKEARG